MADESLKISHRVLLIYEIAVKTFIVCALIISQTICFEELLLS